MPDQAIRAGRIFDGERWHEQSALVTSGGRISAIVPGGDVAAAHVVADYGDHQIVPGFIDLQVNGGDAVQFGGSHTSVDDIRRITAAHARTGTTKVMVTLITDTPDVTAAALSAGEAASLAAVPGYLGLHLEGPHLSVARKGAHDADLIRPMTDADMDQLVQFVDRVGVLKLTIAPENVTADQVQILHEKGIVISLGHSDTSAETAQRYADAGARLVTHLYNAMSPLSHRAPGLVGAALTDGRLWSGMIADGVHVDPMAMRVALDSKAGPGRIFLVTDAMAPLGTKAREFELNGRRILRRDGRLTLPDGTLAGADVDMLSSLRVLTDQVNVPLDEALRMAALYPAQAVGIEADHGHLKPGARADFAVLGSGLNHVATWIGGACA
ncbi:N-acetylglucosamine-6-phosphate deacetylase [Candidatus Rhodobacter oscarellae]|uniref:N-acetylglucosamine-6-phosphate deacetylase n=1 Tax=Candidatus Rhodobacter oscarellae TaxID=1675527 RepID=A0A0J9ECS7_9RHOB|nr:N-acetylglucosamine-6-phosphate deacetylase [Candidatus Rhodobacter lobularis]KMW60476.1 N-acetylglucosamine-6-phosphate deacetylase [Candidatus Rhodobacter lobularis]